VGHRCKVDECPDLGGVVGKVLHLCGVYSMRRARVLLVRGCLPTSSSKGDAQQRATVCGPCTSMSLLATLHDVPAFSMMLLKFMPATS